MRVDTTKVQIHIETHELLSEFREKAYREGLIEKPSANEAIKYLLENRKK